LKVQETDILHLLLLLEEVEVPLVVLVQVTFLAQEGVVALWHTQSLIYPLEINLVLFLGMVAQVVQAVLLKVETVAVILLLEILLKQKVAVVE
jgi:hypothetical protein